MAVPAAADLPGYLNRAARHRFAWGRHDCAMFVADWVAERTGSDPAYDLRARYCSEATATAAFGCLGLAGVVARCARRAGLARLAVGDCLRSVGCIAVLRGDFGKGHTMVCGIRTAKGWAVRAEDGVAVFEPGRLAAVYPIAAWAV